MKKLKAFLSLAFVAIAMSVSASNIVESTPASSPAVNEDGWSKVFFNYNASSLKYDGISGSFPGFSFGYAKGISIIDNAPLYLEPGIALEYRSDKEDGATMNMLSFAIPVNLIYKFDINDKFSIKPLFGLDFRLNAMGNVKYGGEKASIFSEDDFGAAKFGRFQAGWHLGCGFSYMGIELAITYGQDFNEITEDGRLTNTIISLGYNF